MRRVGLAILGIAGLAALGLILPVTCYRHTCVICRLLWTQTVYVAVPVTSYVETDCSRWYAAYVEPSHTHLWERSVCTYTCNFYGMPTRVGCSPGRYPIWGLDPDTQMRVYQHFEKPLEAKAIFAGVKQDDRLEEEFPSEGRRVVMAMQGWEEAGFPCTWDAWWAKQVAEHRLWEEWLHADSGLHFDDWRRQKAATGD